MPAELRWLLRERAGHGCEYCLLHEDDAFLPHEPDHIIAVKHRGETNEGNLAWTCFVCNRGKGSDLASVDETTGEIVRLFHPRTDSWDEHLELMKDGSLLAKTAIVATDEGRLSFQCQPPDRFREEREDGTQGYVKSPWISVQIEMNETEETAQIVLEGDDLDDGENPGRQVWRAPVYKRGNETLIMNFEAKDIDLWDGGIWFCRVVD